MSAQDHESRLARRRRNAPGWVAALALLAVVPDFAPTAAAADARAPAAGKDTWVLFLTIVGERTYLHWGHPGDRPPRVDDLAAADPRQLHTTNPGRAGQADSAAAPASLSAAAPGTEPSYGGDDPTRRPFGPAPQECPRTLPPGSDAGTAEALLAQSGCRYLSSCEDDGNCTWYYQGRVMASGS